MTLLDHATVILLCIVVIALVIQVNELRARLKKLEERAK